MVFGVVVPCVANNCLLDSVVDLAKRVPETLLSGALKAREMTSMDGESFLAAAAGSSFSLSRHSSHPTEIDLAL